MIRLNKKMLSVAAAAALTFCASGVFAVPNVGDALPGARVVDADDRSFELASTRGRPVLVVYEDKDSSKLNLPFKRELARLAQNGKYRTAIALVPVADVRKYDYWPVRGFVKDAIRDESRAQGATIYCDWDGGFSRALSIHPGTSTILLYGKDGRMLFAKAGILNAEEIQRAIGLLRAEVGEKS